MPTNSWKGSTPTNGSATPPLLSHVCVCVCHVPCFFIEGHAHEFFNGTCYSSLVIPAHAFRAILFVIFKRRRHIGVVQNDRCTV
jgi:hypothetical protein